MNKSENIEQLFKDSFEHFEADVNPKMWANIQSGIHTVGTGASAASAAAKFAVGKIIAGTAGVALITGGVWYFVTSGNQPSEEKNQQVISITETKNLAENKGESDITEKGKSHTFSSVQFQKENTRHSSVQDVSGDNDAAGSLSSHETETSSAQEHKYGRSSDKPSPLIRGTQTGDSKSGRSKENPAEEESEGQLPTAKIFATKESGEVPLTVKFTNEGMASSLYWDFGDGSVSEELSPEHTFDKPGTYTVKLTAKNSAGTITDKIKIEVNPISSLANIPNIFTPNGDGDNDIFSFETKNISKIKVEIYDKGGNYIAGWSALGGTWDGKLKSGNNAPEGVYLYEIQATGSDGTPHNKKGTVTLNRGR